MHSSTLFLVALASIMVTIGSAADMDQAKPSGSHIYHKRSMKKRLSPGNSQPKFSSDFAPASAAPAGGLTDDITGDLTSNLLGTAGGATGELPVVNGLI